MSRRSLILVVILARLAFGATVAVADPTISEDDVVEEVDVFAEEEAADEVDVLSLPKDQVVVLVPVPHVIVVPRPSPGAPGHVPTREELCAQVWAAYNAWFETTTRPLLDAAKVEKSGEMALKAVYAAQESRYWKALVELGCLDDQR